MPLPQPDGEELGPVTATVGVAGGEGPAGLTCVCSPALHHSTIWNTEDEPLLPYLC